ncbi:ubiquitin carboxyl-terminal hydrolase 15-like [Macrosteles quadrilineatus]|uniref:ubiquitin carboxyl-terminal hydrolase 15-like n=1 Tax=Macrosteles quadrilineatus TaxID=74068 RepID=UPI0023E1C4F5|nr:ubiquitin carboxyl-terminal hydrolase 15-like [Macrosteles quadrilineatus]
MVEFSSDKSFPDIEAQKSQIEKTLRECMSLGQTWYIIDAKWFKTFKYFVGLENSERAENAINPGPIDNSLLLDESSNLKPGLVEGLDYVPIPESAWYLLQSWYGLKDNHTTIERKVINIAREPKVETRLEVYNVCLNIYPSSESENHSVFHFSNADKIEKIEEVGRKLFQIAPEAKVQVQCFYGPNQSQVLSRDNTIFEESLNSDLKIVVEVVGEEDSKRSRTPVRRHKDPCTTRSIPRVTTNNNRSILGSGMVTRQSINSASGSAEGRGPPCTPGLCGLINLGNTCFLNSVLQCLSNCEPITQYFLEGKHEREINTTNPLGRAGQIATSFADLISMMWSGKHSTVVPHFFKLQLCKFAPQFAGCQQHDAQELLTFLLDGLHEDLNRIKDKPYCSTEEKDLDDDSLARESWEYFQRRNDSVIIDNFHGMLKSRVVCPDCEKVSIKFDTFSTLSLPLPLRCDRKMLVRYVPYDQSLSVRDVMFVVPKKGTVRDVANELSKITNIRPELMVIAEVSKCHFHKFFAMDDPVESIDDREKIFMYNLPEHLGQGVDTKLTVLPIVLWEVHDNRNVHFLNSLFGTPFLIRLPPGVMSYKTLYDLICGQLIRSFGGYLKSNVNNSLSMDIETSVRDREERNSKLFSPVLVNTYCYDNVKKIADSENDVFEVPESFGRELLALQVSRQTKQEFFHESPVVIEDHTNGLRPSPKPTLEDCLTLFTTTEKLGENNAWHCPRCNMKKRATKKLDLWKLPNILIFHLKRFAFNETRKEKLDTKVEFPLTGLNIDHYVVNKHKENLIYDLIGVCNHYEFLMSGHYTANCKSFRDGKWYCFNDNSVTPISASSVQSESAYVLFYQRRQGTVAASDGDKVDM